MDLFNLLAINYDVDCMGITVPSTIINLVYYIVMIIQVVVPILLIIWGMLDFAKGVIGGDEDKIKAGQKTFIQRLITAVVVFLIVTIVKLVIGIVANVTQGDDIKGTQSDSSIAGCMTCFVTAKDENCLAGS